MIGLGVLGAADIARRRTLPAVTKCSRLRLKAIASRDAGKARAFTEEFGGEPVIGYHEVLERDDVQAVYIPLPNSLHEEWVRAALLAGKHVLVEKSFSASRAAAGELAALARSRGLALMENFAFLHHTQHEQVGELIARGVIGETRALSASFGIPRTDAGLIRYRADLAGGALRETGCYPVRLAQLHLSDQLRVVGAHLWPEKDGGVDMAGSVLLADEQGRTAQCEFGLDHAYRNTYAVWGSRGRIEVEWAFTPPPGHAPRIRLQRGDDREERVLSPADQFLRAVTAFADACTDSGAREKCATAAVNQAGLLESIVELAGGGAG
jgi:dTDP-3,4-didehydro-2,6-dideoxy-alpha-D-glucose 3-reductase